MRGRAVRARTRARGSRRTVAVVTGSRAEFGLLEPVMRAIARHPRLRLRVVAAGAHFLPPARTIREVRAAFPRHLAAEVRMQRPGRRSAATTRADDAAAVGRGIEGFTRAFARIRPDWVLVLGDRIEAFAAAAAASIAGIAVAHVHGGDRAEGIADEAMRHAITKMAHLHLAATRRSAERIVRMGERPAHVRVVGSPAIDGLHAIRPMGDREARALGDPRVVILLHPSGFAAARDSGPGRLHPEERFAQFVYMAATCLADEAPLGACRNEGLTDCGGVGPRGLFLEPNHDPGREFILARWQRIGHWNGWPLVDHLPRPRFIALLKRMAARRRGLLVGNSSAGLIECAALGVPVLNVGPRQDGRERDRNVVDADPLDTRGVVAKIRRADRLAGRLEPSRRFGDGRASERIARALADPGIDPRSPALLRKRNTF
jgi:UDP-N-acetylglucosamine 2-epimerase